MPVFLGLDCGGSSSRALATDDAGEILFSGQGGAANVASTPDRRVRRSLATCVRDAPTPDFVCGCFAGLLTPEDRDRAIGYLEELFPTAKIHAEPDYAAALYASEPGTDVCVIAGTGSLVSSRKDGKVVKSGGRGFLLGDQGSAFRYGRDAFLAFLNDREGTGPELLAAIIKVFDAEDEPRLISRLYRSGGPAMVLGKLAKSLAIDAAAGRRYAVESLERNSGELADVVLAHLTKYHGNVSSLQLSLAGGLWQTAPIYRDAFVEALQHRLPEIPVDAHRIKQPPVLGAVQLARELIHGN